MRPLVFRVSPESFRLIYLKSIDYNAISGSWFFAQMGIPIAVSEVATSNGGEFCVIGDPPFTENKGNR